MKANPAYDAAHRRDRRTCIQRQPWCTWCGTTTDLCADHIVPGKPQYGYQVLCRGCNTKRAQGATGCNRAAQ